MALPTLRSAPDDSPRSIRWRLIQLSLVSVLPLALVTLGVAWILWQSYTDSVKSNLRDTAAAMALAVDRDIATVQGQLNAVAASTLIDERDWRKLHAFLASIASERPGAVLSLVNRDGEIVLQSNVPVGKPMSNLWLLERIDEKALWQGRPLPLSSQGLTRTVFESAVPAASGLYLSLGSGQPTVALSIPVKRDGQVVHALTYSFPTASLQAFLGVSGTYTPRLELIDRAGLVIAGTGAGSAAVGSRVDVGEDVPGAAPRPTEATHAVPLLSARSATALTGWTLRASEPRSLAFGRIRQALGAWLVGLVLLLAGAVVASLEVARRIAAPLRALSDGMTVGDGGTFVPVRSNIVEIDALADHLQRTAQAECDRRAELERRLDAERRERAASALARSYRAQGESLRVALDAGQMGTWRLDFRTGRITVDARLCALWDLDAADGVRTDCGGEVDATVVLQRIHPDDASGVSVEEYRAIDDERASRPFRVEFRVRTRDGGWRWLASYGNRLRDAEGAVIGMIGVNFDVTARHDAEQALRDSERRFAVMADNVPIMIWSTDPQGRLEFVNREYLRYFDTTEPAVKSMGSTMQVHPDDLASYAGAFAAALQSGQAFSASAQVRGPGGEWRWIESHGTPRLAEDGRMLGMVGATQDTTDRHAIEKEREQLLDAERAARAAAEDNMRQKDAFLATLSHELRSPLAVIVGWGQVLLGRHGKGDAELAKGLQLIVTHAFAQSQLISDLLDMSAITAGKMRLEWRPLDLNEVVDETVAGQHPGAQTRGITLVMERDRSPVFVRADANRLRQMVGNLLSNALKFTPAGGHVTVRVSGSGSAAEVSVTDDGQGIDPDFVPRLFDRFSQGRSASSRRYVPLGLGLGLAIVRQLVEMHGGQVRAHSDGPGRGSTFTFTLPLLEGSVDGAMPEAPLPPATGRRLRVLVVEDQEGMRDYLVRIFGDAGMDVTAASSGAEALRLIEARTDKPQLLVSDIGMPDLDGYQLVRQVRERLGLDGSALPAIAVTAFSRAEDRDRALQAGFQAHFAKPIQATRLIELARVLAHVPPNETPAEQPV
ncbi:MAG: PAS domain-containing protein [Burkholderiales bacterium]|nr:PAS domain-containing protein [Burkholderiales bacterium]